MLYTDGDSDSPALIFLHGFLGSNEDWFPMIDRLKGTFYCIAIDWTESEEVIRTVQEEISHLSIDIQAYIGYSMGGRIALQLPPIHPSIILSAHTGLDTEQEQSLRWHEDAKWIEMLETQPIDPFIDKWYAQPLFASLQSKPDLFRSIKERRSQQDPVKLASLLRQMSLGKQKKITTLHPETLFLFGKQDLKYEQLYAKLPKRILRQSIPNAGHAIHLENPDGCVEAIQQWSQRYANT